MSEATVCTDCTSFNSRLTMGASEIADAIYNIIGEEATRFSKGEYISKPCLDKINVLDKAFGECSMPNWDGYDALPLKTESYIDIRAFIELLPSLSLPLLDIVPEPNGDIGLEWHIGRNMLFNIGFSGRGRISYAGIFGFDTAYGVTYFSGLLPPIIIDNLRRLFS